MANKASQAMAALRPVRCLIRRLGVAVDGSGNVFIADTHNNRIREVSAGVIQTIAGTGVAGFSGDGGGALSAKLNYPTSIAVDSKGDVYIADTNNCRIRKIAGKAISTVAGNGQQSYFGDGGQAIAAGLDSPSGVAVDGSSNLYISDTRNQRVRMVAAGTQHYHDCCRYRCRGLFGGWGGF